jgi:hypothetical protein
VAQLKGDNAALRTELEALTRHTGVQAGSHGHGHMGAEGEALSFDEGVGQDDFDNEVYMCGSSLRKY